MLPNEKANKGKLAKIARLRTIADAEWGDYYAALFDHRVDDLAELAHRAQLSQRAAEIEVETTYRRDEILWHRLYLARCYISRAPNDAERRRARAAYQSTWADIMAP